MASISAEHMEQIELQRRELQQTRRATVDSLDEIIYHPFKFLDHGFFRVIDYMGSDAAIVQAARVSYGQGTKHVSNDRGLIFYLMRHRHTSPFEMCEIKLHVKLPIFVARQWIRHRTANVNEYSARYSVLSDEFYVPEGDHISAQAATNRQGRGATLGPERQNEIATSIQDNGTRSYRLYQDLLGDENSDDPGLAREIARSVLPINIYTEWYWKTDLHNLLHFLALRADPHAQYEIRAYAELLMDIVRRWVPLATEAFEQYRIDGAEVSAAGLEVIRGLIQGQDVSQESSGMSAREWRELMEILGRSE